MLNMIRAQLFRIVKSRVFVVYTILFCLFTFVMPFSIWLNEVWPAFAKLGLFVLPNEQLTALQLYGASFVGSFFMPIITSIAMGYFVANDFKSGFMKNFIQARGGRVSYASAMVVCALILACATTLVGIIVVEVTLRVQGYVPLATSFLDALQWSVQVALCTAAYASLIILIAIATKSETIAVVGGFFISGGAIEQIVGSLLEGMPGVFAVLRYFLNSYLALDIELLAEGLVCGSLVYVQAFGTILVAGALAILIMRRRSLA